MGKVPEGLNVQPVAGLVDTYTIQRLPRVEELKEWSDGLTGFLWCGQDHVTHSRGSNAVYYILEDELQDQLDHRERIQDYIGKQCGPTWGSQARALLKSLAWHYDGYNLETMRRMLETPEGDDTWHYQLVRPKNPIPFCTMYDLKSAYWQIIRRMPSPIAVCTDGGHIRFVRLVNPESARKWKRLVDFLEAGPKNFRLNFVGVCASGASSAKTQCWFGGAKKEIPMRQVTALAGMAVLAIRVTHEVCQMQADRIDTRYANVDCVLDEHPATREMEVWEELGLKYAIRAQGAGDIRGVGTWRVGEQCSKAYARRPYKARGRDTWCREHPATRVDPKYYKFLLSAGRRALDRAGNA